MNDDLTPMAFVVDVIDQFFDADFDTAVKIMYRIHNGGSAECGVYPYGEAKTKATLVTNFAREHQHPLRCVIERAPTK